MIYKSKDLFLQSVQAYADKWDWSRPMVCKISELRRKEAQSAAFHSMCGEIATQIPWKGKYRSKEHWKKLLVSAHQIATMPENEMVEGLEGELVNLNRESTASMSQRRMSSLLEYTQAWAAGNSVVFRLDDSYLQYPEANK